jgi:hypothetical protein
MKPVSEIETINVDRPDDLFVACTSFEDRCLGVIYYGEAYSCNEAALIRFQAKKPNSLQEKRKGANLDLLNQYFDTHSSHHHLVITERYNPHAMGLLAAKNIPLWNRPGSSVTIDISCFTRIQLLFLLRHFLSLPDTKVRLLYSVPTYYGSIENKDLTSDYDRVFVLPYSYGLYEQESLLQERALIMSLGHDGGRALYAWRFLDPKNTVLILPTSKVSPELTTLALRKNRDLVQHLEMGDTSFQRYNVESFDIADATKTFQTIIRNYGHNEGKALYFMPGGPKPIIVGLALAARDAITPIHIAYPIPRTYNNAYSTGIDRVLEYRLHTSELHNTTMEGVGLFGAMCTH